MHRGRGAIPGSDRDCTGEPIMDADRFDSLTRTLTETPSRRTVVRLGVGGGLAALLGLAETEAKKKKRKKKCKGKKKCGGKCIPKTDCCTGADCIFGQICAQGQCVTGQGTCPSGANWCANAGSLCSGGDCMCFQTMDNQTRCGMSLDDQTCGRCVVDSQCAALYPDIPGVFCANSTQANCGCSPGLPGVCHAPCSTLSGEAA